MVQTTQPSTPAPVIDVVRRPPLEHHAAANAAGLPSAPTHPRPAALAAELAGSAFTATGRIIVATVHPNQ